MTSDIFSFYHSPRIRKIFANPHQLVSISSAALDIAKHPLALDRPHVLMNKFDGPDDPGYDIVAKKIEHLVRKIRKGRPIERADVWIRTKRYSRKELQIERLSREVLPMDRCYINLALVEHSGVNTSRAEEDDAGQKASPFSLFARLKTERPDKTIEVLLPTLFEPRQAHGGQKCRPHRILIHGRAGVGKTTLCKKIIHDFTHCGMWKGLFDRVLWLPLRNLKREERRSSAYNFCSLFYDEYFSQHPRGKDLADALWDTLAESDKTLFILDGLDEVSQDLDDSPIFKELLDQPNLVITSRPHAMLPPRTGNVDLRLETIGFYPDQLKAYVENAFTDRETGETNFEKVSMILSYLQQYPLVQGLVRIPVQLDALCYTWESWEPSNDQAAPKTMTAVYQAIERSLWRKDAVKLRKLTEARALGARRREITSKIEVQRQLLEYLAFTGIYNNLIEFESKHCDGILDGTPFTDLDFLLDETLKCLSFLRTSGPSLVGRDQSYHFLHLTYQEYFAALYFVRQWNSKKPLEYIMFGDGRNKGSQVAKLNPTDFLQRNKYESRYDIFWRFVAGLLKEEGDEEASQFFKAIEAEPLDILGPTHQRLVMHCLSEIQTESTFREDLEVRLLQWLLFECRYTKNSSLAREVEFPVSVFVRAVRASPGDMKIILLRSLKGESALKPGIPELIASVLEDDSSDYWHIKARVLDVLGHMTGYSSNRVISIIASQLENTYLQVRRAAVQSLSGQSALNPEILLKVTAKLGDEDESIRQAAATVLARQFALTPDILTEVAAQLENKDKAIRYAIIEVFHRQSVLVPEIFEKVIARLEDEHRATRHAAVRLLASQSALPSKILKKILVQLDNQKWKVRLAAVESLTGQSILTPEVLEKVALRLEDPNWGVRQAAVKVLTFAGQSAFATENSNRVAMQRKKIGWSTTQSAIQPFGSQSALTQGILYKIAERHDNQRQPFKQHPVESFIGQSATTPDHLQEAADRLNDQNWSVRQAAVEALAGQSALTPEILQKIADQLDGKFWKARQAAVEALAGQSALTPEILQKVVTLLEDRDRDTRQAAVKVLARQSATTPDHLQKIADRLNDQD
jgi:nucleoside-triphosphatase THEP1